MNATVPVVGELMPDFELPDHTGKPVRLSALRGSAVVVYFYPKSDTPGCTVEACGFRDSFAEITAAGAVVLGISPDPIKKQAKFAQKFQLPFQILADEGHALAERFGLWKEKTFMGRKYMGVDRVTFVVDSQGVLRTQFSKVTPATHAAEVMTALKNL